MSSPRARRRAIHRRRRLALLGVVLLLIAVAGAASVAFKGVDTKGATVLRYGIHSALVHGTMPQVAVVPAHGTIRPGLLVFLHGKGQDQESNLSGQFFAALAALGVRAPDVVFPYGGEDSYWHDRDSGAWGRYVLREVIPQAIKRLHADPRRVAIGGLSMGGFGAYDLARLAPGRFCAVGGDSAALWLHPGETAAGAFDSQEDFERNDVIVEAGQQSDPYPGATLWLDVGSEDPFRSADTELAAALRAKGRAIEFHVWPGGHEDSYWNAHWSAYLRFYARALAHCANSGA